MKKTLIALAVLAASGASFAQVSITGSYGFGFTAGLSGEKGFNTTDGGLKATATEDLGGGMSVTASTAFDVRGRGNAFAPTDASLGLTTSFGRLTLGSIEAGNSIVNTSGAPVSLNDGLDNGVVLEGGTNVDLVSFAMPLGPVTASLTYTDGGSQGTTAVATGFGAGAGQTFGGGLAFASGPLALSIGYTSYMSNDVSGATAAAVAVGIATNKDAVDGASRIRLAGSYDLGVAKIGFGVQTRNQTSAMNNAVGNAGMQTTVNAMFPIGSNASAGFEYGNRAANGTTGAGAASPLAGATGYTVGFNYGLSKMTSVNVAYGQQQVTNGPSQSEYRMKMVKSF